MIKCPYGTSDFQKIISQGYYYCDRTDAIPALERAESQLFIRPRRFGKSLLLSMLENYYDIVRKDQFEALFGHLAIGRNPTAWRNRYFILRWDFSCIDATGSPAEIKQSLYNHINGRIKNFVRYYRDDHGLDLHGVEIDRSDALATIESLAGSVRSAGRPIYLLIDEYDNFANTIMMLPVDDAQARYKALVHDQGLMRTVFKVVKASTSGTGFDRVFITGVSPVVMSDITSGHNIAEDIFLESEFADLCGFKAVEVRDTLQCIAAHCGLDQKKADEALGVMRTWYNGYIFVPEQAERVYNPTLSLYFFKQFQKRCTYPYEMLDANLAVDDSKLEYIAKLPGGRQLVLSLAEKSAQVKVPRISRRFGLSEMLNASAKDISFLASFLYYFGMLNIDRIDVQGKLGLKVPNLVMQGLYVERVQQMLLPDPVIRDRGKMAAEKVYQYGDIAPACAFVEQDYFLVFKNRDYALANELTIKTCFLTLLYNDMLYVMDSEPEIGRRYADLTMIIRPDKRQYQIFDVLIEFKFISLKTLGLSGKALKAMSETDLYALPAVKTALAEGKQQALDYGQVLASRHPQLRLKKFVALAVGFERVCFVNADEFE